MPRLKIHELPVVLLLVSVCFDEGTNMSITVADVMNLPVMQGSRIAAGKAGLSRKVVSLAMMEDQDSANYLLPHNFILSNGRVISSNATVIADIMKTLQANEVAGIAVKVGRYLEEIPEIMLSIADMIKLPIIMLPPEMTSAQLISSISYSIFCSEIHDVNVPYEIDLIRSIIIESDDWRSLKSRLVAAGFNLHSKMGVILVKRLDAKVDESVKPICAKNGFMYPFPLYDKWVACINLSGETACSSLILEHAMALKEDLQQFFPSSSWRIGIGRVRSNALMLALSYKEALAALCLGIATSSCSHVVAFRDLGIYSTLLHKRNQQDVNALMARVNLLLEKHDSSYKTELANTLHTYAQCNMSIADTAAQLFVHSNTVRYRINTIKRLMEKQFAPEEVGVNLAIVCTLSRYIDVYREETRVGECVSIKEPLES